jgi:hypothetical protein
MGNTMNNIAIGDGNNIFTISPIAVPNSVNCGSSAYEICIDDNLDCFTWPSFSAENSGSRVS